jgi:phosphate transport system substrate-binding protein
MINVRRVMGSARARTAWGALLLSIAGLTHASTLVGGAAMPSAIAYVGPAAASSLQVFGDAVTPNSLLGVYSAQSGYPSVSYCQAGDGAGKDILAGVTIESIKYNVQNTCTDNLGSPTGFGAAAVGRTDLTQPNFVAVDLPLSATDYTNYVSNHASGSYPTQFPAIAGAIAIVFNLKDGEGNQVTSSQVNFTDAQLCAIFSGAVTNWDEPELVSAFTLPVGDFIPSMPINVQYHSEGSGTTFALSNHLATVCGATEGAYFETSVVFTDMVGNFFPTTIPYYWTGYSGDAAVATGIQNTAGSIGYVETIDALAINPALQMADVNGRSPLTNFGSSLTITASDIEYNKAISITNNANGTAVVQPLPNPPATSCIALVLPSTYAATSTTRGYLLQPDIYPIVGISYLLGNTAGNNEDLAATQELLTAPYNAIIKNEVTTIGPGTGFAFLNLGSGAFTLAQVAGCLVN